MLQATAAQLNCVGGVNGDTPTEITLFDVDSVSTTLMNNNAYMITDNIEGQDRFGTGPVRSAFMAMGNTALIPNLNAVNGFISKWNYPNPNKALESEWGSVNNVRFLLSSIGSVTLNASMLNANVYNIFVTGLEGYACIEQDGYSATFIYRPPIYDGPLALNASVGYKFAEVPRLLNDLWVQNLRCTLA